MEMQRATFFAWMELLSICPNSGWTPMKSLIERFYTPEQWLAPREKSNRRVLYARTMGKPREKSNRTLLYARTVGKTP